MPRLRARIRGAAPGVRRRLGDERGIALVMALGVLFVLSLTLTALVYYTSTNSRSSARERADQQARALADAGINNALAVLYKYGVNLRDPALLPDGSAQEGIISKAYAGGRSEWHGVLSDSGSQWQWQVTARGIVKNPTGPGAADVRRTLTANVRFAFPPATELTSPVWNWIYSGATGSVCDMTIDQSVSINAPLYVAGNLCMRSTAKVVRQTRPIAVVVEGKATLEQPQNAIGSNAARVDQIYVGGGCQYKINAAATPCTYNSLNTNIWANALYPPQNFLRIDQPAWAQWYNDASPGPRSPCTTSIGTPPTFDVDSFLGVQTVPGVFHLTPATSSYTCATPRGEISWNHQTKILKVRGTIFIDGSAKIENGAVSTYDAFSAIYLTGTLLVKNSSLCALAKTGANVGSACDGPAWNPNTKMLFFAARGSGGQVPADTSIQLVSSEFQGGLYGKWAINSSTTTSTQGPQVSEDDVQIGQSNNIGFPLITQVPSGAPLNAQPAAIAEAPDIG